MITENTADNKRFVFRSSDKKPKAYFIPTIESGHNPVSANSTLRSTDMTSESVPPARRVVVVRNTKNPQNAQGSVDLSDFNRPNNGDTPPVLTNGNKLVYLIRRPIGSEPSKPAAEVHHTVPEPIPTNALENTRTTPSPNGFVETFEPPRSPSPPSSSPPVQPVTAQYSLSPIPGENSQQHVPYLRRPRSKARTSNPRRSPRPRSSHYKRSLSPVQAEYPPHYVPYLRRPRSKAESPTRQHSPSLVGGTSSPKNSTSPTQGENTQHYVPYLKHSKSKLQTSSAARVSSATHPTMEDDETHDIDRQQSFTFYSLKSTHELMNATYPIMVENGEHAIKSSPVPHTMKNSQRKATASSSQTKSAKSVKSIVLINPDDQSIAVVENSLVKGESIGPITRNSKPTRITRFMERSDERSNENLLTVSQRRTCLNCLARHICLIIIICFILIFIGLAGAGVSTYFYIIQPSDNTIPKIVGIAVGGALAIAALLFLCILLGCIGSRDGYFTYNDDKKIIGGRALALIPPTHQNAHLYIPRDYTKLVENAPRIQTSQATARSTSNIMYGHPSLMAPVTTIQHSQPKTSYASNSSTVVIDSKSHSDKITIEMPERLITGRQMSARSRERSLNKVVKNIGQVVEDAKKRYNGDAPKKVIIQIDNDSKQNE